MPADDLRDGMRLELERGDDREAPATTAQRPEQLGLVIGVDAHALARGEHDLERAHVVAGQPIRPAQPAGPAAEREPGDADARGQAQHGSEPVLAGRRGDVARERARPGAHDAAVDRHVAQARSLQQHRALEVRQGLRPVAGGLRSHAQAGAQHGLHVLGARRLHDRGGALVDGEVPGPARLVPAGVVGQHHAPADAVAAELASVA